MFERGLLEDAWEHARTGGEAPGLDGISPKTFECDLSANLDALYNDLASNAYRPQAYRVVYVPKESGGQRRLVIATVRDRVAMTAATLLLQPLIAPLLHPCSFAYRAGVGVRDALAMVCSYRDRGFSHALRADVERFFDTVQHAPLFGMLADAHVPQDLIEWVRLWLSAPLADRDRLITLTEGLPQGLPISPLLANLYLTPFDRSMVEAGWKLVRYADDFIVCCLDDAAAQKARGEAARALSSLGLRLADDKTSVSTFDAGFPFLGATLIGTELIYDAPHPYEADYRPLRPQPHRPPAQGLPYTLLRTLYIQQQGSVLACHGGRLVVARDGATLIDLPAHHIDQIFTFGRVHLTSGVMGFCLCKGIPIHLFSGRGSYYGLLHQMQDDDGAPMVRRQQYRLADDDGKRLDTAKAIVDAKLRNSHQFLSHHHRNHPEVALADPLERIDALQARVHECPDDDTLRGIEGSAAAAYFEGYALCFRNGLAFNHRNRHPPLDPINSLLSFGYTMLYHNIHGYVLARGLDPAVGLFHETRSGHQALVSDLLEEFRALVVDALVLNVANRGAFEEGDFYLAPGTPQPCLMKDEARRRFIEAFEDKLAELLHHPDVDHEVDWRRVLDLQTLRFRRFVQGAVDAYVPFARK